MKLLEVAKLLSLLDESIDIHGLARLHKGNPEFEQAVKEYRSTLQGRKKELLKPFGLDDLDKFKEDPDSFVKMVDHAVDSFKKKKKQNAVYKKIYEDDRCLIIMPKGPKGAAAAGSFCVVDGEHSCPWCVCVKYPENKKWWDEYGASALFFIYAKESDGTATDACCILMTDFDALSTVYGHFKFSQLEGIENKGLNGKPEEQRKVLDRLYGKTGLSDSQMVEITRPFLKEVGDRLLARDMRADDFIIDAAASGAAKLVKMSLEEGANPNARNENDNTPLEKAVEGGHYDVCKLLIDAGADVDATNYVGWGPMQWAVSKGRLEICKLLIDAGADVNIRNAVGNFPLLWAALNGRPEICKLLIDAGADINAVNNNANTTLLIAVKENEFEICKTLIEAGADVNMHNVFDESPLAIARAKGCGNIEELLLKAGAKE